MSGAALEASFAPCSAPMRVMRWSEFEACRSIPRSSEALDLLEVTPGSGLTVIFVSHDWWNRDEGGVATAPDFASGEQQHLKYRVICSGVAALIASEGLRAAEVALWIDWFSIEQDDAVQKARGIESMIHFTTWSQYMLIPLRTPHAEAMLQEGEDEPEAAYYPEDIAGYGTRGWTRVEYFLFR